MAKRPLFSERLYLPARISTGHNGRAINGTKAFIPPGVRFSPEVAERVREYGRGVKDAKKRDSNFDRWEFGLAAVQAADGERKRLANKSEYFLKPLKWKTRLIRRRLIEAGVPLEIPLSRFKGRLELFEKGGFKSVPEYPTDFDAFKTQVVSIVSKMHNAGVTHNHLHCNNFVINGEGKIKLIDLARAKLYKSSPRNKKEFFERYSKDIFFAARTLADAEYRYKFPDQSGLLHENILKHMQEILNQSKNNFGITSREIYKEYARQDVAGIRPKKKKRIPRRNGATLK
ncbi:Uncharacterised protein [uncultured archaeon]|nr:Uncharacterised protein [uncultured archaeon]